MAGIRRQNVRSTSCSSWDSSENVETGYASDNSTSDTEIAIDSHNAKTVIASRKKTGNDQKRFKFKPPRVVRKEFVLNIDEARRSEPNASDDESNYKPSRKRPKCVSKNAVTARLNRMKKKKYVEDLENKLSILAKECEELKRENGPLKRENEYLKTTLANSSEIKMLLKSVRHHANLPVTTSLSKYQNNNSHMLDSSFDWGEFLDESDPLVQTVNDFDPDKFLNSSFLDATQDPLLSVGDLSPPSGDVQLSPNAEEDSFVKPRDVGICLHVAQKRVSLEFCSTCDNNAQLAWEDENIV